MRRTNARRLVAAMAIVLGLVGSAASPAAAKTTPATTTTPIHGLPGPQMRPADWWWGP